MAAARAGDCGRAARVPLQLPGLGGRANRCAARGDRGGPGACGPQPCRGGLCPLRPVRPQAYPDGRLGALPGPGDRGRTGSPWSKQARGFCRRCGNPVAPDGFAASAPQGFPTPPWTGTACPQSPPGPTAVSDSSIDIFLPRIPQRRETPPIDSRNSRFPPSEGQGQLRSAQVGEHRPRCRCILVKRDFEHGPRPSMTTGGAQQLRRVCTPNAFSVERPLFSLLPLAVVMSLSVSAWRHRQPPTQQHTLQLVAHGLSSSPPA